MQKTDSGKNCPLCRAPSRNYERKFDIIVTLNSILHMVMFLHLQSSNRIGDLSFHFLIFLFLFNLLILFQMSIFNIIANYKVFETETPFFIYMLLYYCSLPLCK